MTYILIYFLIGLVVAAITEVMTVRHYNKSVYLTYKPSVASLMISTILWPACVVNIVRNIF